MGPLLFIVYTADLAAIAEKHDAFLHAFADDTQLYLYCRRTDTAGTVHHRCRPLHVRQPPQAQRGQNWVAVGRIETQSFDPSKTAVSQFYNSVPTP